MSQIDHIHESGNEISYGELMTRLQNNNISVNQFLGRFPEMREMFGQEAYEEAYNEMYPNPDEMTYEQLLELQEKIGFVEKGFKLEEVQKVPLVKYNKDIHKIDK
jgi:hypothetical protein